MRTAPLTPMFATRVKEPFTRRGWVFEPKYDGWRLLAIRRRGRATLASRRGYDLSSELPEIVKAIEALPGGDLTVDGELVVLDARGVASFRLLQERNEPGATPPLFVLFDCLESNGVSLLKRPLSERRAALEALVGFPYEPLALAERLGTDGAAVFAKAVKKGWEGVIGKDLSSPYEPGKRSLRWLKLKARREEEFVIGGLTLPAEPRPHFGALLVGLWEGKRLRYCGAVEAGFTDSILLTLLDKLEALHQKACPFSPEPHGVPDAAWVVPKLVAQIRYAEWTGDEKLRQPSFLGLREDKDPKECVWKEREA